jgi:fused signal recognition particle receptor
MSLVKKVHNFISQKNIDLNFLEKVEDHLIKSGIHIDIVSDIMNYIVKKLVSKPVTNRQFVIDTLKDKIVDLIKDFASPIDIDQSNLPQVILICGINGSGKTTTVGKMAHLLTSLGWEVVVAACDTFRSAAQEQLKIASSVCNTEIILKQHAKETPYKIALKAYKIAIEKKRDLLIIDTAGRLHNNQNLMLELFKIKQKLGTISKSAPHNTILVIDANCGYSIINQVEMFHEAIGISGIVITKVDIAKKVGSIISICKKFKIAIHGVADGESSHNIKDFEPIEFADIVISGLEDID